MARTNASRPPAERRSALTRTARLTLGAGAALSAVAAGGVILQRRHVAAIQADPEYKRLERPPHGRSLRATSADGTRLNAEVFGPEQGHPIVLAHGWTEALRYWTYVIDELTASGHRCIAFDLRGHGDSEQAASGEYSLQRFGEDVDAVLVAALADGERATIVGHSLGAMSIVAWAGAHEVRARADAVALVNTGVEGLLAGSVIVPMLAGRMKETVGRVFMGTAGPLPRVSTPLSHEGIRYFAFGRHASPAQIAFYEQMLWQCSPRVRAAIGVSLSSMDLGEWLAHLTVPALVVAGSRDRLTPPAHAHSIAERLPDCRQVLELADCGHMGPLERPLELSKAILATIPQ